MNGVVIIDKPEGMTSFAVVSAVRKAAGVSKAGHGGTLDPLATGVLPVMLGSGVGASDYIMAKDKKYLAGINFGFETDTEDITGIVTAKYSAQLPSIERLREVCKSFTGSIMQTPPMYSAKKVGGRKLVDLARKGIELERKAVQVEIYSIEATETERGFFLTVHCGKGTYIRTLCADIGKALGCGAVMSSLRRLSTGRFDIADAVTPQAFADMTETEKLSVIIPCEALFDSFPTITLEPFFERLFRNGVPLRADELPFSLPEPGALFRVCTSEGFFALGECIIFNGIYALKVKKFFG